MPTRTHTRQNVWRFAISTFLVDHLPLAKRQRKAGAIAVVGLQRLRIFARGPEWPDWGAALLARGGQDHEPSQANLALGGLSPLGRFSAVFRLDGALPPRRSS